METRLYFKGKPVEKMSREELIEVVNILGKEYESLRKSKKCDIDFLSDTFINSSRMAAALFHGDPNARIKPSKLEEE